MAWKFTTADVELAFEYMHMRAKRFGCFVWVYDGKVEFVYTARIV